MIKLQDCTPSVYYDKSRDFQLIGRLFDIVLNSVKTNIDLLDNIRDVSVLNDELVMLLAMTLGFKANHKYNIAQLRALCCVLPLIYRKKGSLAAVQLATNAILGADESTTACTCTMQEHTLILHLPEDLTDLSLIYDIMPYILPAGISCQFISEISETKSTHTALAVSDKVIVYTELNGGYTKNEIPVDFSISGVLKPNSQEVEKATKASIANAFGIMQNTVIPDFNEVIVTETKEIK